MKCTIQSLYNTHEFLNKHFISRQLLKMYHPTLREYNFIFGQCSCGAYITQHSTQGHRVVGPAVILANVIVSILAALPRDEMTKFHRYLWDNEIDYEVRSYNKDIQWTPIKPSNH